MTSLFLLRRRSNGGYQRAIRFVSLNQENHFGYWVKSLATTSHTSLRHHASIETNDTGPQSFASGSLTHPTEDVRDIHSDVISYQSNRVDPADRSLSPSYASRSATESAQCDQRPPFPTAAFSMSGIYAQRPDSSDMPAMMTYAPYNIPNQEANTSDRHSPHGGWDPYASSDRQAFSPRNYHLR
jgi:hypothetical protein